MLFSSISFLYYFFPIILAVYFLTKDRYKNLVLLIFSLFFYFYGEPKYTLLIILSALSGYIHGILIDRYKDTKHPKLFLISGLFIALLNLSVFKYTDFIIDNINYLFGANLSLLRFVLPIGISFYTFQIISYIVDVYKKEAEVCTSFIDFASYICLFPQLIAGPIVRYTTIQQELNNRKHSFDNFSYGVNRFIVGLSKKVIIANNLGLLVSTLDNTNFNNILSYWIIAIAFSLQIYYDFSGYSDMAIGIGRIFGFHFLENFNYPFISRSITEFWRRWHMSLSSFFRDYVYIPLGGNRVSSGRWIFNIFVVWFLTGLWHGDSWNFIIWGLYFAILLMLEKIFLKDMITKLPYFVQHLYTLFFIIISFVIFYNENTKQLFDSLYNMFGFGGLPLYNDFSIYYLRSYFVILVVSIIGATPFTKVMINKINKNKIGYKFTSITNPVINIILLLVVTAYLVDGSFNPFLYFRF